MKALAQPCMLGMSTSFFFSSVFPVVLLDASFKDFIAAQLCEGGGPEAENLMPVFPKTDGIWSRWLTAHAGQPGHHAACLQLG